MRTGTKISNFFMGIFYGIIFALGSILLIGVILGIYNAYQNKDVVGHQISIENQKISRGDNLKLFYDISNMFDLEIKDLKFTYYIKDKMQPQILVKTLKAKSGFRDVIQLPTSNLEKGDYSILTKIEYFDPLKNETKTSELSLNFQVY